MRFPSKYLPPSRRAPVMKAANGARGAPSVFALVTDALCLALISVCVAVSVAAAVFGVATVVRGYPTFGGDGYCYVGD